MTEKQDHEILALWEDSRRNQLNKEQKKMAKWSRLRRLRHLLPRSKKTRYKYSARIAIAKDVLLRLEKGTLLGQQAGYLNILRGSIENKESFETFSLSGLMKGSTSQCSACAIGAACLAAVGLYDDSPETEKRWGGTYTPNHSRDVTCSSMRNTLSRFFTRQQLDLIECAFEKTAQYNEGNAPYEDRITAATFGLKRPRTQDRMISIFQNIIDNRGEFKP